MTSGCSSGGVIGYLNLRERQFNEINLIRKKKEFGKLFNGFHKAQLIEVLHYLLTIILCFDGPIGAADNLSKDIALPKTRDKAKQSSGVLVWSMIHRNKQIEL